MNFDEDIMDHCNELAEQPSKREVRESLRKDLNELRCLTRDLIDAYVAGSTKQQFKAQQKAADFLKDLDERWA